MFKILLIGSHQNKYDLNHIDGISILFELLITELKNRNISFETIDTLVKNNGGKLKTLFFTNYRLLKKIRNFDHISLHGATNSFLFIAPLLLLLASLFNKTVSIRFFTGNFGDKYHQSNFIKKLLLRIILKKSDIIFFELKHLVSEFKAFNQNTFWFPNVRDANIQIKKVRKFKKRFVYIGSINEEKGIDELCEVINRLDKSYTCDLYGPIKFKKSKYSVAYFKKIGVNYMGAVNSNDVLSVMDQYDVLILPSHREGYPGVIIEAFALGMPIIATKLLGIMEMCEHNKNALLIDVQQPLQLLAAIKSIDQKFYTHLHKESTKSFINFNSKTQTNLFLEKLNLTVGVSNT